jgi:hypothetical protein
MKGRLAMTPARLTLCAVGVALNGAMVKTRSVSESPDADHRMMTMFATMPDGKEMQTMRITYTRWK